MISINEATANLEERAGGMDFPADMSPMKREYFALFGKPVVQSLSPLMHNAAMTDLKYRGYYFAFQVENLAAAIQGVRGFGLRGVSVTMPYKEEVISCLDEIDPAAAKIGAVNTIVNEQGCLKGYNTDWLGMVESIEEHFNISGKVVLILGSGGAARAAIYGISARGGFPLLAARNKDKTMAMARHWQIPFVDMADVSRVRADVLINTTPIGMVPEVDVSPLPKDVPGNFPWVMDMIYRPVETRLLKDAREAGSSVIDGLGMFLNQGVAQFKLWTDLMPSKTFLKRVLERRLSRERLVKTC